MTAAACAQRSSSPMSLAAGEDASASGGDGAGGRAGALASGGSAGVAPVCTPQLAPGDEFYVPCEDAGMPLTEPDAARPPDDASMADAGEPDASDAGNPPHSDAGDPPDTLDEGPCAVRETRCDAGRIETTAGAATCTLLGDALSVQRELCEVCGEGASVIDYGIVIMDCGVCSQVFRSSEGAGSATLGAGQCRERFDDLSLFGTASSTSCVDVYAYVGTGMVSSSGSALQFPDEVRICRCDRTTGSCIACAEGACDDPAP